MLGSTPILVATTKVWRCSIHSGGGCGGCRAGARITEMDKLDPERRSANMARVRGKDTGPEIRVRKVAHSLGMRFRLHRRDLPGTPDLVFPKHKLAVFVHGCFWHRHHACKRATMPTTRPEFWAAKFEATKVRDARQSAELNVAGWKTLVLWECELRDAVSIERKLTEAVRVGVTTTPDQKTDRKP